MTPTIDQDVPPYVATEAPGRRFEVWHKCGDKSCRTYHGPMATCDDRWNAERIVRALTEATRP